MEENVLVCDIETAVVGERPDPNKDILKFVGFMDMDGRSVMFDASQKGEIQYGLTEKADFIVGHNFKEYDAIVLERHGFSLRGTTIVDTLDITRKRVKAMMYVDLSQGQMNLRYLAQYFGLHSLKGDIDYDIFKKNEWTKEELRDIKFYLDGDLSATKELFEYYYNFFIGFKDFVNEADKKRMSWLTTSPGTVAYKAVCNMAGLAEEYEDVDDDVNDIQYQGAFVALPEIDKVEGDIYVIDFSSLYPHMYLGGNLYSPTDDEDGWHGSGIYKPASDGEEDGIVGTYSRTRGKIEQTIKDLYDLRVSIKAEMRNMKKGTYEYKTADARQLATKIIINTIYGISGSKIFKSVYNLTTAADCTSMARMSIKHARGYLTSKGYVCLYTDTDSVYVLDPFKNRDYMEYIAKEITMIQRKSFNIDIESHDFEIEAKLKRIYFFRDDNGDYVKKLYAYVKDDDNIVLKGLPLVKGTCSNLSKEVYEDVIKPDLLSGNDVMYSLETIEDAIRDRISLTNIEKRFRVNSVESYKSPTCIQAQIAAEYGAGEHFLIPNTVVGAGKGVKYAKIGDIERYGDVLSYVDIRKHIGELKHFIPYKERKMITSVGKGHTCKSFTLLDESEKSKMIQHVECKICYSKYVRIKPTKSAKWQYLKEV